MALSDREAHERREDDRAYLARQVELKKVEATRDQTEELRALRGTLEQLLAVLNRGDHDVLAFEGGDV